MQSMTLTQKIDRVSDEIFIETKPIPESKAPSNNKIVSGLHKSVIRFCIRMNIIVLALYYFKNPIRAFRFYFKIKNKASDYRGSSQVIKYVKADGRYFLSYAAPGFPSMAFNRYILNNFKMEDEKNDDVTLDVLIFGITKKCGYQCEHCFEWEILNKPETMSRENLLSVIHSFQEFGLSQIQLSGGEPMNRIEDVIYLLQNMKKGSDIWIYTSGYHLTHERSAALKKAGLTGVIVSLDHWVPELHDQFRGKQNAFEWAEKAAANARSNNLVVCLSLCATKEFVSKHNLEQYMELAKRWSISFIQILEPKAVGHFEGKDISLSSDQIALLEDFLIQYNFEKTYRAYPILMYHGFYNRRVSCGGAGRHFVYVDTDGDVNDCPFCKRKAFSALHDDIRANLRKMVLRGCIVYV